MSDVTARPPVSCWLTDMDGVLVREERAIPGGAEFIAALEQHGRRFLVLTNNSIFTARDLRARLLASGIDVPEESIWTSALATAQFLADQAQGGSAYVIGEAGLTSALHDDRFHPDRVRPRLRRARRDPDLLVRGDHQGHPADREGRSVHRHQPRRHRAVAGGIAAGHRFGRCADLPGHRRLSRTTSASPTR